MSIKSFDEKFDIALWVVLVLLCLLSWRVASKLSAPRYEAAASDITVPYIINAKDGTKVEATYRLTWEHSGYSPKLLFHDFDNDNTVGIKDEYLSEYLATTPPSAYPHFYNHIFWWMLIGLVILSMVLVFTLGQWVRDKMLYRRLKEAPTFTDVSYFLFHSRFAHTDDVRAMLPRTAPAYIASKRAELEKTHSPQLVNLAMSLLGSVARNGSTEIPYYLSLRRELEDQNAYLNFLEDYWKKQLGVDANAQQFLAQIAQEKKYYFESFPDDLGDASEYDYSVTSELNAIFKDIMGSEVFKFARYALPVPGKLKVEMVLKNTTQYFTWTGKSEKFPGIRIGFTISEFRLGGKDLVLWQGVLNPSCDYTASEDDFSVKALYKNMIHTTIDTLAKQI